MKEDPIVAEVRRVREEHAALYNYDLRAIYAVLKKQEKLKSIAKSLVSTEAHTNADGRVRDYQNLVSCAQGRRRCFLWARQRSELG